MRAEAESRLAQRLGEWLDWREAIGLFTLLQGGEPASPERAAPPGSAALAADLDQLRRALCAGIAADAIFTDPAAGPAACRNQHAAWQQRFELRLAPLRERLRAALRGVSPALAHLAALDAVMHRAWAAKERQLLAAVPALLGDGDAAAGVGPRWQDSLRAELALRLQPIEGLLAALTAAQTATQTAAQTSAQTAAPRDPSTSLRDAGRREQRLGAALRTPAPRVLR